MSYKLKVIKSKEFEVAGNKHQHHVVAYKGRVFGLNTMRWEGEMGNIQIDKGVMTISCDIEVVKRVEGDALTGETKTYLDIMPKCGLVIADF